MYYLIDFKHFVSIFSLTFNPISLILYFLMPHFHKTLDQIGSNFFRMLNLATETMVQYPNPQPGIIY